MKVNILGKGRVPGVNKSAPVENVEASIRLVSQILKIKSFKVVAVDSGVEITRANLSDVFSGKVKATAPVEIEQVETPVELNEVVEAPAIEEPVEEVIADVTEEEVEQSFVEDVSAVEEQLPETEELEVPVEDTDVESFDEGEDAVEETAETSDEEKPKSKKKRRK